MDHSLVHLFFAKSWVVIGMRRCVYNTESIFQDRVEMMEPFYLPSWSQLMLSPREDSDDGYCEGRSGEGGKIAFKVPVLWFDRLSFMINRRDGEVGR